MSIEEIFEYFLKTKEITTDTRKITKDCIFFALKGDNFNGNEFAKNAINLGAKLAIVDEKKFEDIPSNIFYVNNSLETLQNLASLYRKHLKIPIIGLTGSNGKTTTKELIFSVLKEKFKTHSTFGNLNNHIGVPLTILSIPENTDIAVIEMGANHIKEIELLTSIVQPDYGYITNFGKAHLEGFGSIEGVIKGKSELYEYLKANNKVAFVYFNDATQVDKTKDIQRITFSENDNADYKIEIENNKLEYLSVAYKNNTINSNLTGKYNYSNIACAITIGLHFDIPINLIKKGIENYYPSNNRSQIIQKNNFKIIMDAYNANPSSMELALKNFSEFEGTKSIIIGDMLELGTDSLLEHQKILDLAENLKFDNIFILGKNFGETIPKNKNVLKFNSIKDFELFLQNNILDTKNILIKGSHSMRLDLINLEKLHSQ